MPLLFTRRLPAVHQQQPLFGVWHILEEEAFFRERLLLTAAEEAELAQYKDLRRREWLAVRYLLHLLTGNGERWPLSKDAFSKPFFLGHNHLYCSLSHSKGLVGALLADVPAGCDLQVLTDKMPRLAWRFLHEEEFSFLRSFAADVQFDLQHVFWTAKESLYKAYGLKAVDFRRHLRLEPFDWEAGSGETTGWVCKQMPYQPYQIYFERPAPRLGIPPFIWAVCLQIEQEQNGT
ncbi:MAG: 4'-phosphopantetheinyl transferase superfamily protein [Saprospiraceae bacterium]|nr:4'-phosphopantetheinyl transferase superfamily protein [Saprospiraceae bacterium]MDW8483221.1 4'-phosphopantetheinyl transferase superfamily protein [Saprospiraceae bacterium]